MLIAGFQRLTLLDYPGKIAALLFTQGCNFACGYCHNPEMIPSIRILPDRPELNERWILNFLKTRKGLLDGIVITGGEPTLQRGLLPFLRKIKKLGFIVKLDTNGSHPEVLKKILDQKLAEYIAMDIKHAPAKLQQLVKNDVEKAMKASIALIMNSGVDYEFRSTILPHSHSDEDIAAMGLLIKGAKHWYLQSFRPLKTLDRKFLGYSPFTAEELLNLQRIAQQYVGSVDIRT